MKQIIILITSICGIAISCQDRANEHEYKHWNPDSIEIDSAAMLNIIGKWHLITAEDTISNIVIVDSNEALVFLENGDYGIETNNIIKLKENSYCKITYNGIYYINKQNNKVDSIRNFLTDNEKDMLAERYKDRLGFLYEIRNESTFGCSNAILQQKIIWYKKR